MAHILVIEDDPLVRSMLKLLFEREGYQVSLAAEGDEALRRFQEAPADLIVTDIIMPGKEGIETIIEFRKRHPLVQIIAISGGGRIGPDNYLKMAESLGAARTFSKPLQRQRLMAAVQELIGSQQPTAL